MTAYAGAAALIKNKTYLSAAQQASWRSRASTAGLIRTVLGQVGGAVPFNTQAIANLRSKASNAVTDVGVLDPATGFIDIAPGRRQLRSHTAAPLPRSSTS